MTNNFVQLIDMQMWRYVASAPNAHAAGVSMASDLRNSIERHTSVFQLVSNTVLNRFNIKQKAWNFVQSPALAGTFGAGAGCVFAPSSNLKGSIGAGCTTSKIVTTTVMTAVGVNMLANRGGSGDYGFKIKIIGNAAGSSGKTEERWIIGNTGGTTPTLLLNSPLSFTPANGDTYEILSGSLYMLGAGTLASGSWKSFEVASNTLTTRTQTNLPATISTDHSSIALDERYVPHDLEPGEGFIVDDTKTYNGGVTHCLQATATASGTLTGQATGGDASVLANEYRNFQIRIVEDTATPTAVGQRRIIASHTAGASPVYTLGSAWTVTPSSTAKYVIEYPNLILLWSSATAVTYTYNYGTATINNGTNSIAADAWHVTYFANRPAVMAAGCTSFQSHGIRPDSEKNARHSFIFSFRGGNTTTLDLLDIAAAINGTWSGAIVYDGGVALTTGACGTYAPCDQEGKFGYLNAYIASAVNQMYRFDVQNRVLTPVTATGWLQAGTAAVGDRIACYCAVNGSDKYNIVLLQAHTSVNSMELVVQL